MPRPNLKLNKIYRFRLQPTWRQQNRLILFANVCRWVWNWGLARRTEHYKETGKGLTFYDQCKELVQLKHQPGMEWLEEVESQILRNPLQDLERAFALFFKGISRYPKFKSKKIDLRRFRATQNVNIKDGKVHIAGIGWMRFRQSREIEGKIKFATCKRSASGHWYVSIATEFEMPDVSIPLPDKKKVVGIDLGLTTFAVFSDKTKIENPRFYRKSEKKLRKLNKSLHRKQKGSKNRNKARIKLARYHQRTRNKRNDFLHKLTTNIVRKYDGICIEDLNLKGLVRTKRGNSKSFYDAAMGEFRFMLTYKALWHRKTLSVINRFYPSSKMCRVCGEVNTGLTRDERVWTCPCGMFHDRDENAATNIKNEGCRILASGQLERLNACGENRPVARTKLAGDYSRGSRNLDTFRSK